MLGCQSTSFATCSPARVVSGPAAFSHKRLTTTKSRVLLERLAIAPWTASCGAVTLVALPTTGEILTIPPTSSPTEVSQRRLRRPEKRSIENSVGGVRIQGRLRPPRNFRRSLAGSRPAPLDAARRPNLSLRPRDYFVVVPAPPEPPVPPVAPLPPLLPPPEIGAAVPAALAAVASDAAGSPFAVIAPAARK